MNKKLIYIIGGIFLIIGIILSVFFNEPHFYTFFSIGLFLIFFQIYNSLSKKSLFENWKCKHFILFFLILITISIFIDKIGIYLGYWDYPHYSNFFDEIVKYIFEWVVALLYVMIGLMIGIEVFNKYKINKKISFFLSMIIFVIIIGFFTEYFNLFSNSWNGLSMPISNYKIGEFFIIFQTIGYWLMALIPFLIYKFVNKFKK